MLPCAPPPPQTPMELCVALIKHPAGCRRLFSQHRAQAGQLTNAMLRGLYLASEDGCGTALEFLATAAQHMQGTFFKVGGARGWVTQGMPVSTEVAIAWVQKVRWWPVLRSTCRVASHLAHTLPPPPRRPQEFLTPALASWPEDYDDDDPSADNRARSTFLGILLQMMHQGESPETTQCTNLLVHNWANVLALAQGMWQHCPECHAGML